MKVVILGKWPTGEIDGGVANHTINLVKSLSELNGIEVFAISFGNESKIFKQHNVNILLIKSKKTYYIFPFLAIYRLLQEIKKIKTDIIHLQGSNLSPYLVVVGLLKDKYPFVSIILGIISKETSFSKRMNPPKHIG